MTEANVPELNAINDDDFEDEDFTVLDSRDPYDDLDEAARESRVIMGSAVSTLSEIEEPEEEYDTDLEMEEDESAFNIIILLPKDTISALFNLKTFAPPTEMWLKWCNFSLMG